MGGRKGLGPAGCQELTLLGQCTERGSRALLLQAECGTDVLRLSPCVALTAALPLTALHLTALSPLPSPAQRSSALTPRPWPALHATGSRGTRRRRAARRRPWPRSCPSSPRWESCRVIRGQACREGRDAPNPRGDELTWPCPNMGDQRGEASLGLRASGWGEGQW